MNKSKLIIYGAVPFGVSLVLLIMYFSGIEFLQQMVIPQLDGKFGSSERELGILENLQNLVLIAMLVFCVKSMRIQPGVLWKLALTGLSCFTLLVLLEEIDYGLHYYEYFFGIQGEDAAKTRNLHNVGKRTNSIKQIVDLGMIIFFVILPFALKKSENRFVRHFLPDRYSGLVLIAGLIISKSAHYFNDMGMSLNGVDNKNTSEFRELATYYLCMLYYWEVLVKRRWVSETESESSSEVESKVS